MRLTHLEVTDHRNIAHAELHPDPHLTVLCGPNGQGKTNLLEAIWLLTGGKSFRGSKDAELIRRGCDFSVIEGAFETQDVEKSIRLTVGSRQSQRPGAFFLAAGRGLCCAMVILSGTDSSVRCISSG